MVQTDRHIDKTVCFVDKEYRRVGCSKTGDVKCSECGFCQKYEGKEKRYFFYTRWTGVTDKNNLKGMKCVL